jgi:hypothetical protein
MFVFRIHVSRKPRDVESFDALLNSDVAYQSDIYTIKTFIVCTHTLTLGPKKNARNRSQEQTKKEEEKEKARQIKL